MTTAENLTSLSKVRCVFVLFVFRVSCFVFWCGCGCVVVLSFE